MAVFVNFLAVFYGTEDECRTVAADLLRSGLNASVGTLGLFN